MPLKDIQDPERATQIDLSKQTDSTAKSVIAIRMFSKYYIGNICLIDL
jgi:hypothetical protein